MLRRVGSLFGASKTSPTSVTTRRHFLNSSNLPAAGCAKVWPIPLFDDNYSYLVVDPVSRQSAVVDPGDAAPVIDFLQDLNKTYDFNLTTILSTHKHNDHVGGNLELKQHFPLVNVIGTGYEDIPGIDRAVFHDDIFTVGELRIRTLFTPCHTLGHVCFYVDSKSQIGDPILFSGDTLFVGGCGRFFEGSATEMLKNMDLIAELPSSTQIYCGHEYTLVNLDFLKSVASGPASPTDLRMAIEKYHREAYRLRNIDAPTVPSTVQDETSYNLFFKCRERDVQDMVGGLDEPAKTMQLLRDMKNNS